MGISNRMTGTMDKAGAAASLLKVSTGQRNSFSLVRNPRWNSCGNFCNPREEE